MTIVGTPNISGSQDPKVALQFVDPEIQKWKNWSQKWDPETLGEMFGVLTIVIIYDDVSLSQIYPRLTLLVWCIHLFSRYYATFVFSTFGMAFPCDDVKTYVHTQMCIWYTHICVYIHFHIYALCDICVEHLWHGFSGNAVPKVLNTNVA